MNQRSAVSAIADGLIPRGARVPEMDSDLRVLFHRLNNQLGIILAHAELLEAKASDEASRSRAAQVVASILDAMATTRELRNQFDAGDPKDPSSS